MCFVPCGVCSCFIWWFTGGAAACLCLLLRVLKWTKHAYVKQCHVHTLDVDFECICSHEHGVYRAKCVSAITARTQRNGVQVSLIHFTKGWRIFILLPRAPLIRQLRTCSVTGALQMLVGLSLVGKHNKTRRKSRRNLRRLVRFITVFPAFFSQLHSCATSRTKVWPLFHLCATSRTESKTDTTWASSHGDWQIIQIPFCDHRSSTTCTELAAFFNTLNIQAIIK